MPATTRRWLIQHEGSESGPYSDGQLAKSGQLLPGDEVRLTNQRRWVRAASIRGLVFSQPDPFADLGEPVTPNGPDTDGDTGRIVERYRRRFLKRKYLTQCAYGLALMLAALGLYLLFRSISPPNDEHIYLPIIAALGGLVWIIKGLVGAVRMMVVSSSTLATISDADIAAPWEQG